MTKVIICPMCGQPMHVIKSVPAWTFQPYWLCSNEDGGHRLPITATPEHEQQIMREIEAQQEREQWDLEVRPAEEGFDESDPEYYDRDDEEVEDIDDDSYFADYDDPFADPF